MQKFTTTVSALGLLLLLGACGGSDDPAPVSAAEADATEAAEPAAAATPRYDDGTVRFDRMPGELGYWANPSQHSLIEKGVTVQMDDKGMLANIDDASKVAPFMDWSLALYRYRQANGLKDDPVNVCISPAGPRHLQDPMGFRILQDRNLDRVYVLFGGGNRNWRHINMDGRAAPNLDEVQSTFFGYSNGSWDGDTLVVESSGFNDRFWFSNGGLPHTPALKLTERFTRQDHDTLVYSVTIDDPRTYTRPWVAEWTLDWVPGDIDESFCEKGRPLAAPVQQPAASVQ
ncbi:MAG: hypothetical protein RLZZ227_57 [Pseudomonadota bacterium]|jgi:hypothetical protein